MAMPSGSINMLCQAIQQNSSILEEINEMLEQATTSGNMLYQAIQQNPSILEEINEMLEQAATSGNVSMLYRSIQQNPSILEEINEMLEQAATFGNINRLYQAIQQNSSILEEVSAIVDQAATSGCISILYQEIRCTPSILEEISAMLQRAATPGKIDMLYRAIQQNPSLLVEINTMLEQAATSGNINMLYRAIQQNPSLLVEVNAMLEQAPTCGNINMLYRGIPQNRIILQVMLVQAATCGNINMLYQAIQQNPSILKQVDAIPFVNTPLHIAASAGQVEFAIEIMGLKPSLGFKLNSKGLSPIHVALLKNRHKLVRRLVEINKDLVRVKGKERLTPLHLLCQSGSKENISLLIHFLDICPDSIKDVNVRRETALHIALRCGNLRALQEMVDWLIVNTFKGAAALEGSILNWTVDGNNILHLATLSGNTQAVKLLIRSKKMKKNAKNSRNQTALDLANSYPEIEKILERAGAKRGAEINHGGHPNLDKAGTVLCKAVLVLMGMIRPIRRLRSSISSQQREAYLVVAALIITAIYQTALNPPGGLYQPDNNVPRIAGKANMTASDDFVSMSLVNTGILYCATLIIFILIPDGVIGYLLAATVILFTYSYVLSIESISPTAGKGFDIFLQATCFVLTVFLLLMLPLLISWHKHS